MSDFSWNVISTPGAVMNNAEMKVNGTVVYTGNYTPIVGMNTFTFSTPITYTGGDLVVEWCFDNTSYSSGSNVFESSYASGNITNFTDYYVGTI